MKAMVAKYSSDFPVHPAQGGGHSDRVVVLLTGSTGGLGCYLLSRLASDASVARIFAFNRPARDRRSLRERQKLALINCGIDPGLLYEKKIVLLEGDLTASKFALPNDVYDEVRMAVVFFWQLTAHLENDFRYYFQRHTSYTTVITLCLWYSKYLTRLRQLGPWTSTSLCRHLSPISRDFGT